MNDRLATSILHKVFNAVSFGATSYGLALQFGDGVFDTQSVLAAIAIAAVIQTVVLLGWPVVGRALRRGALMMGSVMFLVVLLGALASGHFASTTYIKTWLEAFLYDTFHEAFVADATEPLGPIIDKALTLQQHLADYERFSEGEALRERTFGDSCDGASTVRICGPICELRTAQAGEAAEQAGAMRDVVTGIDQLRAQSVTRETQDGLIALTEASNAFLRDPTFDKVVDWAAREKAGFEGLGFPIGDRIIQCRDAAAIAKLEVILATAQLSVDPATTPRLRAQGFADVASANLEAFTETLRAGSGGLDALQATLTTDPIRQFLPLWIFAGFIELICALLGLALVPKASPFRVPDPDDISGADEEHNEIAKETYNTCAKYLGPGLYFLVPYDGDKTLRENALILVQELPSRRFTKRGPISVAEVMEPVEAELFTSETGAKMAEIFVITRPTVAEAKIASARRFTKRNIGDQNDDES